MSNYISNIPSIQETANEAGKIVYQTNVREGIPVEEIRELETPIAGYTHLFLRYWVENGKFLVTMGKRGSLQDLMSEYAIPNAPISPTQKNAPVDDTINSAKFPDMPKGDMPTQAEIDNALMLGFVYRKKADGEWTINVLMDWHKEADRAVELYEKERKKAEIAMATSNWFTK